MYIKPIYLIIAAVVVCLVIVISISVSTNNTEVNTVNEAAPAQPAVERQQYVEHFRGTHDDYPEANLDFTP